MYSFKNDYSEGAHPKILEALIASNLEQTEGYGEDHYSQKAAWLLKEMIGRDDIAVHFFVGGTQTNLTAISAFLRPHQAVIAAATGHIATHETGAIEATGHKVITVETSDGKLRMDHIQSVLDGHTDEHMVSPKMVYISNSTEVGSIYKKAELEGLSQFCKANNLLLYLDGARLGSALTSKENDMTLLDLGRLTDVFYIGGTKNGALMGEALIICNDFLKEDFRFHIKQKGALLAKGRLLGIQFEALFKDNLYFELAEHANQMAVRLQDEIKKLGFSFLISSPSNQVFPIFPNSVIEKLQEKYAFHIWEKVDDSYSAIRLVTSWATKEEAVSNFVKDLNNIVF
ncbi:threonine aldolase family protein [Cellulosilyticum sp. I15G10I2]|uniref:threonine aldolase family protein n=1 Tax=Cellulosilyticum sp. I15G10I2 TaxID=1892843 RepID=UPI00085CD69D|nr:low specificity L-threonine aldolase [Cellulosilyticum sp. I15G10I2]